MCFPVTTSVINSPSTVAIAEKTSPVFTCHVLHNYSEVSEAVIAHFTRHDAAFYPALSNRGSIMDYIQSIFCADGRLIVYQLNQRIVAAMGICFNHPDWKYYFQYMSVDEEYRRQGLQGKLLDMAIILFGEAGANRIVVRTWSTNNASQGFFRKHGFIHFKTIFNDRGTGVHTCLFTKVLAPLRFEKPLRFLGLIGGMGSFCTGAYIKTLTSVPCYTPKEQSLLPFLVVNDPSIPDRTDFIRQNRVEEVVAKVNQSVHRINQQAISHLIILCFTFHPFIPLLSPGQGVEIIDLIGVCKKLMRKQTCNWLLIATKGTYAMNSFASLDVNLPADVSERERIHAIILEIKSGANPAYYRDEIAAIAAKNGCGAVLLGCTDLHGMFGFNQSYQGITILDPLLELTFHIETIRQKAAFSENCV